MDKDKNRLINICDIFIEKYTLQYNKSKYAKIVSGYFYIEGFNLVSIRLHELKANFN